jgi:hypothetical protein
MAKEGTGNRSWSIGEHWGALGSLAAFRVSTSTRDAHLQVQAAVCTAIIASHRNVKRLIHKLFLKDEEKLKPQSK